MLNQLAKSMAALDRPISRHEHVHRNKAALSCLAGAQGVEVYALGLAVVRLHRRYHSLVGSRKSGVEQTMRPSR